MPSTMGAPPATKPDPWKMRAAFAMAFSLGYLALSILGAAWTLPHRYAPVATDFDTGFMGGLASADNASVAISWGASRDETFRGTAITIQDLTFFSERWNGVDITIAAALARPRTVVGRIPALVVVHGYGGTHESMMGVARELAASGRVAIAIDAPDSGGSTPYPRRTPEDLVNVTTDPRGGFLYHVAYAASRALSVAESLAFVDPARLGALGASQGGLTSLYLAAKDPRVSAALPMIPGRNPAEAYCAPSPAVIGVASDLAGVHVTSSTTSTSEVVLLWRGSTAAETWRSTTMAVAGGLYSATVMPMWPGRVSLFVSIVEAGAYTTATPVIAVDATGYAGPALLIATAGM